MISVGKRKVGEKEVKVTILRCQDYFPFMVDLNIILFLYLNPFFSQESLLSYCWFHSQYRNRIGVWNSVPERDLHETTVDHMRSAESIWDQLFKDEACMCTSQGSPTRGKVDRVLGVGRWGNKCKRKPSPRSGTGRDGQEGWSRKMTRQELSRSRGLAGISSQAAKQFFRGPLLKNEEARTQASRE